MVSGGEVKSLIARPVWRRFYFLKREFVRPRAPAVIFGNKSPSRGKT